MHQDLSIHQQVTQRLKQKMEAYEIVLPSRYHEMYVEILTQYGVNIAAELSEEARTLYKKIGQLKTMLYEDDLTKTLNRKWLHDTLMEVRSCGTLILMDVDKLKEINDTYGHVMGDNVLIYFALKLKETKARVIRYGGDEFILIFDHYCSALAVGQQLVALIHTLKNTPLCTIDGKELYITFSFGMVTFDEGMKLEDVIETADKAMYRYKNSSFKPLVF